MMLLFHFQLCNLVTFGFFITLHLYYIQVIQRETQGSVNLYSNLNSGCRMDRVGWRKV